MSTDSIEAKFRDLMVAEAESNGTCCPACSRALALAVLEEAFAVPALVDSIYVARKDVDALHARIVALGLPE